jgi:hypothetical protein
MDAVVPWAELEAMIEPHYLKAGNGRQPGVYRAGWLQWARGRNSGASSEKISYQTISPAPLSCPDSLLLINTGAGSILRLLTQIHYGNAGLYLAGVILVLILVFTTGSVVDKASSWR